MPQTNVVFYCDQNGESPTIKWLADLRKTNFRAYAKCAARIERLAAFGHELRRPEADLLRDGIHELRVRFGTVNYRILYFLQGRMSAVLTQGLVKEGHVPDSEINTAINRKQKFQENPTAHTFKGVIHDV
jgi:putative component of toxin-antitoxin plasmid stabilization module